MRIQPLSQRVLMVEHVASFQGQRPVGMTIRHTKRHESMELIGIVEIRLFVLHTSSDFGSV